MSSKSIKPIILLPKGAMSKADIKLIRANSVCAVECTDPNAVRLVAPIVGRERYEVAAIQLFKHIVSQKGWNTERDKLLQKYGEFLVQGVAMEHLPKAAEPPAVKENPETPLATVEPNAQEG